jgi:hypothetical protein
MKRMNRTLTRSVAMIAVLAAAGCSKAGDDGAAAPASGATAPAAATAPATPGASAADPHGGGDPHGGAAPPHGGAMGGGGMGGGATLERTADGRARLGPFLLTPPAGWEERKTSSSMRAAEWRIPGVKGQEDGELVVYHFGTGGAGGVQANIDRWVGQFAQADGSPSKGKAKIGELKVAGQKATVVEVSGRYVAAVKPGASEKLDKPEWQMFAAIVESPAGAYYFKMLGPVETVRASLEPTRAMLGKMELVPAGAAAGKPAAAAKPEGGW